MRRIRPLRCSARVLRCLLRSLRHEGAQAPRCVSSAPPRKGLVPYRAPSGSPALAAHGRFLRSLLQQNRVFGSLFLVSARFEDARRQTCWSKRQVACFPLWTEKGSVCQTGDFAAHELPNHARPKPAPCARSGRLSNVSRETFAREQGVQAGRQDRTKKSARNQLVPGALRFWRRR